MAQAHVDNWTDARAMSLEHPDTFESPDDDALRAVRAGTLVKICNGQERFWVLVAKSWTPADAGPCEWAHHGAVQNELVFDAVYDIGDTVSFRGRHIYGTFRPCAIQP